MYRVFCTIGLILSVVTLGGLQTANADLLTMDSASFAWKYEMNADPSTEDVAPVAGVDWIRTGTAPALSGGIMTMAGPTTGNYQSYFATAGSVWSNVTRENGWTLESRIRVPNETYTGGKIAGLSMLGETAGAGAALLMIAKDKLYWTYLGTGVGQIGGTMDNSTDFHTYRIAEVPTGGVPTFNVWRDDVLVGDTLAPAYPGNWGNYANVFGTPSGFETCNGEIDYVRLQSGAYAPVPEPTTLVLLVTGVIGLLAYAWRKRK